MYFNIILFMTFTLGVVELVSHHPLILVISFDGFRYNYLEKNVTPTLEKLKSKGTHAKYMRNVFVTKTFPNHHSIATGLYPEVHGVVANSFYDPRYKKVIKYSEEMWNYTEEIVPIWTLNELEGDDWHSGVYMWPGSNFPYRNITPTFHISYNPLVKWKQRVDTVISWFLHPQTPANLVMMYFEEPDAHSHRLGPESKGVLEQLRRLDNITCYLQARLLESNLTSQVNVLIVSDHGMTTVTSDRVINVTQYVNNSTLLTSSSPALHVIPTDAEVDEVYRHFKNVSKGCNYTVYRKEELLDRWHYKHNIRTPPILLLADEGYAFDDLLDSETHSLPKVAGADRNRTYGVHGYDNAIQSMHAFFLAWGPQIKRNHTIKPFDSIDLYNLFGEMLGLRVPPTNGSLVNVEQMLRRDRSSIFVVQALEIVGVLVLSLLIMGFACCATHHILKRPESPPMSYRSRSSEERGLMANQDLNEGQHLLDDLEEA